MEVKNSEGPATIFVRSFNFTHYWQKSQILIFDFATLQTKKGSNTITLHILGFSILGSGIFTTQFFESFDR